MKSTLATQLSEGRPPFSLLHEILFLSLIVSTQLLAQAGLGQVIAPLHIIGPQLGTRDPGQLSWMPAAYSLTIGTFILISGRLGDVYGHRRLLVVGFTWYAVASLGAGLCAYDRHSPIPFDVLRALQGIGPGLLLPNALAILGRTYKPGLRKALVFAIYGGSAPTGFILGATFSSLVAQLAWWPWAYWLTTIVCAALAIGSPFIVPADHDAVPRLDFGETAKRLDLVGSSIGILGLCLFNVAWNQAPLVGWQTSYVIVFLVVGIALIAAFLVVETKVAHPILPWRTFSSEASFVLACVGAGWSSFGVWMYYWYQIQQIIEGDSPLLATAKNSPVCLAGMTAAMFCFYFITRLQSSLLMMLSMCGFLSGNLLMALKPAHQIYWAQTFVATLTTPWGMDISFPSATLILSNAMPVEHQGMAGSLVATMVNYGISIGLGIAGTVEVHTNRAGTDTLRGFRGALFSGVGLAGFALLTSVAFFVFESAQSRGKGSMRADEHEHEPKRMMVDGRDDAANGEAAPDADASPANPVKPPRDT
ncbi:MFS general substrate transporter [Ceraceosorus guamensis]|uniref:MFS general substrate transporter n=1 Tax=Ceraceosorus guamensis TaxID=1522189 RepID=A0A316VNS5_9BASI|nr:MFS general substrate transporter [Ceraceosorus guamensis]PWN38964.1 MFS general substrate transporter [Ceraceosorus guamensis]